MIDIFDTHLNPHEAVKAVKFSEEAQREFIHKVREQHNNVLQDISDMLGEAAAVANRITYPDAMRDDIILADDSAKVVVHTRKEVYETHTRFVTAATLHMDGQVEQVKCAAFNVKSA